MRRKDFAYHAIEHTMKPVSQTAPHDDFRFSPRPHRAQRIGWRAWSAAAFAEARARNRPILLCITAAWSRWSHLMDEQAYSDDTVQFLIKTEYVPVRVDAAARPDVDRRYNRGGLPTTAFLTPEGELMAGATYIPPQEMRDFLVELADEYRRNRDTIRAKLGALEEKRRAAEAAERAEGGTLAPSIPAETVGFIAAAFDRVNGGLGEAPKFTHTEALGFALEWCQHTLDYDLAALVKHSLDIMALSNLFDREDGVFFRFANDAQWENPEREVMLEENAALVSLYMEAAHVFREDAFRQTGARVLRYLVERLRDPATGAYYGGFFAPDAYYHLPAAQRRAYGETCVDPIIHARENALAAQAFLDAFRTTEDETYCDHAIRLLAHMWQEMWDPQRGMARNWTGLASQTVASSSNETLSARGMAYGWGWLPDQTAVARAFAHAYETTGARAYLDRARAIAEHILRVHYDPASGGFWDTATHNADSAHSAGGEAGAETAAGAAAERGGSQTPLGLLAHRQEVLADTAAAAELLIRLWRLTGNGRYRAVAETALANYAESFRYFGHFGALYGQAVDRLLRPPTRIVVVGARDDPPARALFQQALRVHTPAQITQWLDPARDADLLAALGIAAIDAAPTAIVSSGADEAARAHTPAELAAVFEQVESAGE